VLLDEPLANLDYKLREELRLELPKIFAASGAIFVYATTEPSEALLLGGNTATLSEGRITQFGRHPSTSTAARAICGRTAAPMRCSGPSGCGKTTLLNIISGLLHAVAWPHPVRRQGRHQLSTQERNIAQVFQFPVIYDTMTVYDNLAFPLRNRGVPEPSRPQAWREIARDDRPCRAGRRKARA
jgi:ABC-type sugar transport system ATPase subunit